jgi:RNA recognition motif-containing protein
MSGLASIFAPSNAEKFKRVDLPVTAPRVKRARREEQEEEEGDDAEDGVAWKKRSRMEDSLDLGSPDKKKKPKHEKRKKEAIEKINKKNGSDALDAVEKSFVAALKRQRPVEEEEAVEAGAGGQAAGVGGEMAAPEGSTKEQNERTVFAGNIPVLYTVKKLKTYFKEFGTVASIRLRSVPFEGIAVDQKGNQDLVRKVAVNTGKIGAQKGSLNAYIVFESEACATAALAANNRMIGDRHLRVDRVTPTLFDPKLTVFLGGLPYYADEENLREHFAAALANGQDDIASVRIVRDPETLVCKGIGYVLLGNTEAVFKALTLNKSLYRKRELRVSTCGKRTKKTEAKKSDGKALAAGEEPSKKREKRPKEKKGAERRVDSKIKIKREILGRKKAKKNSKPKKTKQLGGVIKRAIKLSNAK